jgi:hypothetical protein
MKGQYFKGYTAVIGTCVPIALVPAFSASAQTDVGCRQQRFGRFSEWSAAVNAAVNMGPVVNSRSPRVLAGTLRGDYTIGGV